MSFFGSLFDPIKSFLTPAGTNASRKQQEGQQWFGDFANTVGKEAGQNWADWLKLNRQFNPQMQAGLSNLANMTSAAGLRQSAIRGGNFARAQAQSQSVPMMFAGNPALAEAYRAQQLNKANDYQNQRIQQSTSPEAQSKALMQLFQAIGAASNQAYQPFGQAANVSFGTPKVQVQPGILDYAGGIIGNLGGKKSVGANQQVNPSQYSEPIGPSQPNDFSWLNGYHWG